MMKLDYAITPEKAHPTLLHSRCALPSSAISSGSPLIACIALGFTANPHPHSHVACGHSTTSAKAQPRCHDRYCSSVSFIEATTHAHDAHLHRHGRLLFRFPCAQSRSRTGQYSQAEVS